MCEKYAQLAIKESIHRIIEFVGYLYRTLTCKNMPKCKAFLVSIFKLKFYFSSISILSFSCSCKMISMNTILCTKNRGKKPCKCTITCEILRKEFSNSGGRKLHRRN